MFDVWGFGWVWVGLGQLFCGLGWVDENRPTDNSVDYDRKECRGMVVARSNISGISVERRTNRS